MQKTLSPKISDPMFSNGKLLALAIPVVIDALLFMLMGLVDSTMVSSAGSDAVSAVSLVDSLAQFFLLVLNSLAAGGGVVAAQYIGRNDYENARGASRQVLYLTVFVSLIFMFGLMALCSSALRLFYGDVGDSVLALCENYFFYILLGFPFVAVGAVSCTMLRSMAYTKEALYIAGTVNILNVIGNAIFIYGFDMGVTGAALSTTLSRVVYAALGLWVMSNRERPIFFEKIMKIRLDTAMLRRVTNIGVANSIEGGLVQFGSIILSMMLAALGTTVVTVCTITCKVGALGWSLIGALQTVLLTVVGQCVGAGEHEQARFYTKKFVTWTNIATIVGFGLIILFRNQLAGMFKLEEAILAECSKQILYASVVTILTLYSWSFIPLGAFRAAGDTKFAVVLSIIGMFAGRVATAYVCCMIFDLGVLGMWVGMGADHIIRAVMSIIRFNGNKWLEKKVI